MKKGRYPEAWKSMLVLRNHEIQVARDIYYISALLEIEKEMVGKTNYVTRFSQLFTIPRVRRANLAAFTVMIAQQMCGINIIAFYSTTIFVDAGLGEFKAMIGSFGFGLINWLFAFPAFWTIDTVSRHLSSEKKGRRSLTAALVWPTKPASVHLPQHVLDSSRRRTLHSHGQWSLGRQGCSDRPELGAYGPGVLVCLPLRRYVNSLPSATLNWR